MPVNNATKNPKPRRPVWLFSLDSDQFYAAPTTTGGLKAYYQRWTASGKADIELIHFRDSETALSWKTQWQDTYLPLARSALAAGITPVAGFSFYTWNAAEFLELLHTIKADCPELMVIAGGPHVQQAEDYLGEDPVDLIFLGEAEQTFTEVLDQLDATDSPDWHAVDGLAWLADGNICKSAERSRIKDLDRIPSPLDVVPLTGADGKPLYPAISYETSRGCPFKCAFCEWGTGAIGTKMNQFSMDRIRSDWQRIAAAGVQDMWLADSNFGALKEDLEKAQLICELKKSKGFPATFATSWSKKHSPRVQQIVLMMNRHQLLPHYQLALQTLTPEALRLSNRQNMAANKYEPIAREMAEQNVPIAAELIWGLPGDTLAEFEANLDQLLLTFPNVNIFGYTLLPGTEFYEKRDEYKIQTLPVAGYGKARGEYVIGCHTFDTAEGMEGYYLITAHILFVHGHLLPLTVRSLSLARAGGISGILRSLLSTVLTRYADHFDFDTEDRMQVYENRAQIYHQLLADQDGCYALISQALATLLDAKALSGETRALVEGALQLDQAFSPKHGQRRQFDVALSFDAAKVVGELEAMRLPGSFSHREPMPVTFTTPGGADTILKDPDGGSWLKGALLMTQRQAESIDVAQIH